MRCSLLLAFILPCRRAAVPRSATFPATSRRSHTLAARRAAAASRAANGSIWSHVPSSLREAAIRRAKQNILEDLTT